MEKALQLSGRVSWPAEVVEAIDGKHDGPHRERDVDARDGRCERAVEQFVVRYGPRKIGTDGDGKQVDGERNARKDHWPWTR